jgi:hypothetical protein
VKSYVRFKRLLPARQAKSLSRSHIARHLAMFATWQMRVSLRTHPNPQPQTAATRSRKTGRYLCTFPFLCFSLAFFLKGVLVGVGDGVPEGSGVGDGRTRG